jgi:hypothetical protein
MDIPDSIRGVVIGLAVMTSLLNIPAVKIETPVNINTERELAIIQGNSVKAIPTLSLRIGSYGVLNSGVEYYHLLCQYEGWDCDKMFNIMFCESSLNPVARGDLKTAYHSYGLLQIRNLPCRNYTEEELFDPARNIEIAYEIFLSQGYGAWKNCLNKIK